MKEYFASLPQESIGGAIIEKVRSFSGYSSKDRLAETWRRSYEQYFKLANRSPYLRRYGDSGEFVEFPVNQYRSILQQILNLITKSRPAYSVRSTNTDYESQQQAIVATSLLDHYTHEGRLGKLSRKVVELALIYGSAFLSLSWNANRGDKTVTEEGEEVTTGDLDFMTHSPFDVFFDTGARDDKHEWAIIREYKHKYKLAAEFKNFKEDILNASPISTVASEFYSQGVEDEQRSLHDDYIPVYTLFHKRGSALPEGRLVQCLESGMVIVDVGMPYNEVPLYHLKAG